MKPGRTGMTLKTKASFFISLMRERHFNDVREQAYRETRYPAFLPPDNRPENSFYVEVVTS